MTIVVRYNSIDHFSERRVFKTIEGARKYAHHRIGPHPEIGSNYAVSDDGVGKITVSGASLAELFPSGEPAEPDPRGQRFEVRTLWVDEFANVSRWSHLAYAMTWAAAKAIVDDPANADHDDIIIVALCDDAAEEQALCREAAEIARLARVPRAAGCTCSDEQLRAVGCDCTPF